MKQLLRFFMLWLIGLMATSLQAQTWTASPVGNGTFYLYNDLSGRIIQHSSLQKGVYIMNAKKVLFK